MGRPELTRERFIPDPFAAAEGARLYRTGDRARWNTDGTIDFLGRLDHQVKVRGQRIELGEIEAVLEEHAWVRQAAVLAFPSGGLDAFLAAYVVPAAGAEDGPALAEALRRHAAARLPGYMVPQAVTALPALPLTASGKVDRRALPAPGRPAAAVNSPLPRNRSEAWLLEQWRSLLGGEVGLRENLFEAGGTSLTAAQLVGRIRSHFGQDLPLVRVFEHPTVEALAALLERPAAIPAAGADPVALARERAQARRAYLAGPRPPGRGGRSADE